MMTFNEKTNDKVKELLTLLNHSRRRVRIWYGDTETGRSWNEEHHIMGEVGRSTGLAKIPLIIANRRSNGGPSILDHCIIRIDDTNTRRPLYIHPNFHTNLKAKNCEVLDTDRDTIVARFNHPMKANHYVSFMEGLRYTK